MICGIIQCTFIEHLSTLQYSILNGYYVLTNILWYTYVLVGLPSLAYNVFGCLHDIIESGGAEMLSTIPSGYAYEMISDI